ncbi:MAG: T9SS type A sorting domain-containing protein, partial [bacterium]
FTLILRDDCPPAHEAILTVSIETLNGFSLIQEFGFSNRINLPKDLAIINRSPVTLKWTGNLEFIGYHIYRKDSEQQSYTRLSEFPILDSTYIDPTTETGYHYFYYVTGIDSSGWESPPSNVVTLKLREKPKFLFFPVQDTSISNQDSIRFVALPQFNEAQNYTYQWKVNGEPVLNDSNGYFIDACFFQNNNSDTITVIINHIELDTTITHQWIIGFKESITKLKIKSVFPASDTTLNLDDSLKFHISFANGKNDTLQFQWLVNEEIVDEMDSTFVLFADSLTEIGNIVKAIISNQDTVISYVWNVRISQPSFDFDQINFSPASYTTISSGDSIVFMVNSDYNNIYYEWLINDSKDSLQTENSYLFRTPTDSTGVATISVRIGLGDTTYLHQWLIKILKRNRSPEILTHTLPSDTTVSIEDTLLFSVHAFDPDQDSLFYRWYSNQNLDSTALDSFYTFFKLEKQFNSDTISVQISDNDTSIFYHWVVHYFADLNQIPQIFSCSPPIDSILMKSDSIRFQINCHDPDGDTLRFLWSLNGWIDSSAHDSTYWYRNLDSTLTNDTLNVIIADADTSIKLEWILWTDDFELESEPIELPISWYPEQDSIIADHDSLIFWIGNADSCYFQWAINGRIDSTANDSIFTYHLSRDSMAIDTIDVNIFDQDSLFSHRWYIHYFSWSEEQLPLSLDFKPKQDVITVYPGDSLKFSVRIIEGEFADLNLRWLINNQLDTTAFDTVFNYYPEYSLTTPDTIKLFVSRADTMLSHEWIIYFSQQQTVPAPHLIFPAEGNHVSEEDKLIWENDSSLAQIDSTGSWNYVVQLSRDSTFLELISTDSCNTTDIQLNELIGFDRISIGKPIYWRVKVFSGFDQFSEFKKCDVPCYYYPQFAQLENFYGQKNSDGSIDLFWTTSYEKDCAGFNIYRSESQDDNFIKINDQLISGQKNYSFHDITPQAGTTYYYRLEDVSLNGNKKFHYTIAITAPKPDKYSLSQNYPNPFNSKTSFKFEIPINTHVKIEVCNILGRKVKTLVDEEKEVGFYTVYWDGIDDQGEGVVSGIYFYSLETSKKKLTRKMIVVR